MWTDSRTVRAGDLVIIWMTRDGLLPLTIEPGKELNGRYGVYSHNDLIGVPFGSKVASRNGRGYVHLLRPTPELWTIALPHRTQILYMADIAFISSWLNLKPGSKVIEAGTGSGSFSHSVARSIGPSGHLHSYEYHSERASKARKEFAAHGMNDRVTLSHRNVCKDGFDLENEVDAVFLDLPAPWDAVQFAAKAMKKSCTTRICCFSPCMEQVLRTVTSLNDAGFTGITMYETLIRPQEIQSVSLPSVETSVKKLKEAEVEGEERRQRQIERARSRNKRKREGIDVDASEGQTLVSSMQDETPGATGSSPLSEPQTKKRRREDDALHEGEDDAPTDPGVNAEPNTTGSESHPQLSSAAGPSTPHPSSSNLPDVLPIPMSRTQNDVRGHTSYLTFAVLLPYEHITGRKAVPTPAESPEDAMNAAPVPPPATSQVANLTTTTDGGHADYADLDEVIRALPVDM